MAVELKRLELAYLALLKPGDLLGELAGGDAQALGEGEVLAQQGASTAFEQLAVLAREHGDGLRHRASYGSIWEPPEGGEGSVKKQRSEQDRNDRRGHRGKHR